MIENRNFLCQAFTIQVVNCILLITKQGPMGLDLHMSIYLSCLLMLVQIVQNLQIYRFRVTNTLENVP